MILNNIFHYKTLERVTNDDGTRFYVCPDTGENLPSVTTILGQTGDKTGLLEWREWVGHAKAEQIKNEACALGSLMHEHLENYVTNVPRRGGTNPIRVLSSNMANVIIKNGLSHVSEIYGIEVALYFPGLYAGTTDLVAKYKGDIAIIDYKTARKMKTRSQITDYFLQLSAYKMAHDHLFGTSIETAVIFMVSRDLKFSEFVIKTNELKDYSNMYLDRIAEFLEKSN